MVDFELTPEQQMYRETARAFADGEIRPAAEAIRERDPALQTPWDLVRPVFRQGAELGFTRILIPEEYGGVGGTCLDNVIVMEELGAADLGIAASYFNVTATAPMLILSGWLQDDRGLSPENAYSLMSLLYLFGVAILVIAPETKGQELPE